MIAVQLLRFTGPAGLVAKVHGLADDDDDVTLCGRPADDMTETGRPFNDYPPRMRCRRCAEREVA